MHFCSLARTFLLHVLESHSFSEHLISEEEQVAGYLKM